MRIVILGSFCFAALSLLGCSNASVPSASNAAVVLAAKPASALGVIDARKAAKDKQEIVVTGRIGGEENPFVDGVAAFTVVDMSLKFCADEEGCPTPWDYCCVTDQLPQSKALIKVVDESGKPIASDARRLLGVKELSTVTVRGVANRDDAGNLTVLASGVFVDAN